MTYFPGSGDDWEVLGGASNPDVDAIVEFGIASETDWPIAMLDEDGYLPGPAKQNEGLLGKPLGPAKPRGGPNGIVLRHGKILAEWGDTSRADMTFSIAKSYLAILAGLAVERGLIKDIDDPVRGYVPEIGPDGGPGLFSSSQNKSITWRHLLRQTSEWEGTLWDRPDLIDRNRQVGVGSDNSRKGQHRDLKAPGEYWEYNDVRVNLLALCLLYVFRAPLPDVLREAIMEPIGASNDWSWNAYDNAKVTIDGVEMPSVPGGSHWGGGLWISTRDHARVGYLLQCRGNWNGQQLIDPAWIDAMTTPCPLQPIYGFMTWLNTNGGYLPSAPHNGFGALGAGNHIIWVMPEHDVTVLARWVKQPAIDGIVARVVAALQDIAA